MWRRIVTIQEAFEASQNMDTGLIQPTGGEVAHWYASTDPSMTDLLYLVAYLLHQLNEEGSR